MSKTQILKDVFGESICITALVMDLYDELPKVEKRRIFDYVNTDLNLTNKELYQGYIDLEAGNERLLKSDLEKAIHTQSLNTATAWAERDIESELAHFNKQENNDE